MWALGEWWTMYSRGSESVRARMSDGVIAGGRRWATFQGTSVLCGLYSSGGLYGSPPTELSGVELPGVCTLIDPEIVESQEGTEDPSGEEGVDGGSGEGLGVARSPTVTGTNGNPYSSKTPLSMSGGLEKLKLSPVGGSSNPLRPVNGV